MYKQVTLEVSLKPFKQTTDEYINSVCQKIFRQWYPLLKDAETVSVMLWAADGKEFAIKNSLDATKYENNAKMY